MKVRRTKPYVCVDCDFADHHRFQATEDVDAAAGTWLRCLAYSRAQQQDGLVKLAWLRRTFATSYARVEELIKVGLLIARDDGDYEIHAYAPRNQTRAMMDEERTATRERVREWRRTDRSKRDAVTPYTHVTNAIVTFEDRAATFSQRSGGQGSASIHETRGSHATNPPELRTAPPLSTTSDSSTSFEEQKSGAHSALYEPAPATTPSGRVAPVTRYKPVTTDDVTAYENVSNAFVPTSTSSSLFSSSLDVSSLEASSSGNVMSVPRADAGGRESRGALPRSERAVSGPFWLAAFSAGITEQTGRPCTVGRMYLETLERVVTHHAPLRDASNATVWLKDQAKAFAAQWDGKHPAKGLTPDGLERWLNEGRQGPPVFGRLRIVQPPAEQWHQDDWSDLGAKVDE